MVIFGAAGDLTKRLVVPALYNLVASQTTVGQNSSFSASIIARSIEQWREGLTDTMDGVRRPGGGEFEADHIDQDGLALAHRAA